MRPRALAIDDDAGILRLVEDILESLGHECDSAEDQDAARKLIEADKYAYVLLDLEIPVKPGKLSRVQNGVNLLEQIRITPGMENVPVIVMTGHGHDSPDLAVDVLKKGAVDYVKKPFDRGALDKAVQEAMAKVIPPEAGGGDCEAPRELTSFNSGPREMVIYEDRVTVCGIEVWRDCGQPHMREFLVRLNKKEGGGWVRMSGRELMKGLARDESNPVGRPIKSFRDAASERLAEARCLECGRFDIIASKGGYYFTEWMTVRVDGASPDIEEPSTPAAPDVTDEPRLNDRQKWILEQIEKGIQLRQKDVITHFRRDKNASTIKRDLKQLRDGNLIETHPDGYYVSVRKNNTTIH